MRLTIGKRLFLALTAVSMIVLLMSAVITRWNLQRGFLDYVDEQELSVIDAVAASLAASYADGQTNNWEAFRLNPRLWTDLLRQNSRRPGASRPPAPPQSHRGPPPEDPFQLGRRIFLADADGELVVGAKDIGEVARRVPIEVAGKTVGFVGITPRRQLTNRIDQEFFREQERSIYLVAIAALLLAALISAVVARQLTLPIRSLAKGARAISSGRFDTRMAVHRDDELGDLAREFNELAEKLEKIISSRRQLISDIAHELRTPLAIVRGELDAIEDGVRQFDIRSRQSMQDEIARLSSLVDELHDLAIFDEGQQSFQFENIELGAVLGEVLAAAEQRLQDAGIELTSQLPAEEIVVSADSRKIARVFVNLIENCIRYTDSPGRLQVRCYTESGEAVIEFSDSAPGVPADTVGRLFDRLYRVDTSRNRETGGSGLGLAICKAIVDAHGGSIEASASDLGGLLIRVRLPMRITVNSTQ